MKTGNAISNISHAIFGMFDHLYIELSDRCNLRCKHCYLDAGAREENTLDSEVVKSALADFAALGGQTAAFSGGEPLLYPEFDSILDYSRELPLRVTIVTNGTLLTREKIAGLLEKGATLALSIEGYREETHDLIRGSGNFLLVRRVLDILKIMKAQDRTIICVTPSKPNIDELTGLVNMLVNEGFHHFYLSLLEERGRENRHAEKLSLTVEEKVRLLVQVMFLLNNHSGEIHLDAGHLAFFFPTIIECSSQGWAWRNG
jgi:MoaA/NifB/PqqE/SkfB family radical SAM enzyme